MKNRKLTLILGGLLVVVCGYLCLTPALEWYFRVPEWVPYWAQDGRHGDLAILKDGYTPVTVVPYRGTYRNAVTLELHDGILFREDQVIADEQVTAVLRELCRGDSDRIIVVLTPPAEKLGHILHAVDLLRKASIGHAVIMYDKLPSQSQEPAPTAVAIPADAGLAPAAVVASHL